MVGVTWARQTAALRPVDGDEAVGAIARAMAAQPQAILYDELDDDGGSADRAAAGGA